MPPTRPLRERFEEKVDRRGPDECWPWLASIGSHGYGQITITIDGHRRPYLAHRVAYQLYIGPIPPDYQVDHVDELGCTVKHCCNPAHLEAVTQLENLRRQYAAGRTDVRKAAAVAAANRRARTHCCHGHAFTPENTGIRKSQGGRYCRACLRERSRDARRAARAA